MITGSNLLYLMAITASGPGMQALQAKLEKKKKREALSAVMKEEASSPVMDLSCVSGSANTDTEGGGGDQLHPMDDTDSAVDSTSNSALQKSLPGRHWQSQF